MEKQHVDPALTHRVDDGVVLLTCAAHRDQFVGELLVGEVGAVDQDGAQHAYFGVDTDGARRGAAQTHAATHVRASLSVSSGGVTVLGGHAPIIEVASGTGITRLGRSAEPFDEDTVP